MAPNAAQPAFGSIFDLQRVKEESRCLFFLPTQRRYCGNPIDRTDRKEVSSLQKEILDQSGAAICSSTVQRLQELCCCKAVHRKVFKKSLLKKELCEIWLEEVKNSGSDSVTEKREPDTPSRTRKREPDTPSRTWKREPDTPSRTWKREPDTPSRTLKQEPDTSRSLKQEPDTSRSLKQVPDSHVVTRSTIPRYNLRSLKLNPQRSSEEAVADSTLRLHKFVPIQNTTKTLTSKLLDDLTEVHDQETGDLYIFERDRMLKIGYGQNAEARLDYWRRNCRYRPVLKHVLRDVPHARRVESLVHFDLLPYWRRELQCKYNPDCTTRHREWFDIDEITAIRSMNNFGEWMTVAEPYDQDRRLKPMWRSIILKMEKDHVPVTSQALLDALYSTRISTQSPRANAMVQPAITADVEEPSLAVAAPAAATSSESIDTLVSKLAELVSALQEHQIERLQGALAHASRCVSRNIRNGGIPATTPVLVA